MPGSNKIIKLSSETDLRGIVADKNITYSDIDSSKIRSVDMDTLFHELKKDMREREQRSEQRYKEQEELLLNKIDKKLDDSLSGIRSDISGIKQDVKDVKNSTFRWGAGLVVTIFVALIGALPQIINTIVDLVKLIPNP